jgi:iron complex transport system substrate-binding protein
MVVRRAVRLFPALFTTLALACAGAPATVAPGPRWVSLSPSTTELLFALGAGPEVAGVCDPADWPLEARSLPTVAAFGRLDAERIMALHPACVFTVEGMQAEAQLVPLRRVGVPLAIYPARSLQDLYAAVRDMGTRMCRTDAAGALELELRRSATEAAPPGGSTPVTAAVVVSIEPLVIAGGESFLSDLLRRSGFANIFSAPGEPYPAISLETLAAGHPRAVIFPSGDVPEVDAAGLVRRLNRLLDRPATAVEIPADLLVRPGPRTGEGLVRLAAARRELAP